MFCSKCGKEVREGTTFCGNCRNVIMPSCELRQADAQQQVHVVSKAAMAAVKSEPPIIAMVIAVVVLVAAMVTGGFGLSGCSSVSSEDSGKNASVENSAEENNSEEGSKEENSKNSIEEYTWAELSAISSEIAEASDENAAVEIAKKYNLVGEDGILDGSQRKNVMLSDGTQTSVQIAGFVHDDKSDGGKAGITFIFSDAIAEHEINPVDTRTTSTVNTGGWEASEMRSWLGSEGKALLPQDLQDALVEVEKLTNNTGQTKDDSSVTATSDELWLFSYVELAGAPSDEETQSFNVYSDEGSQYKLFRDQHVARYDLNSVLTKTYNGESCNWWERSPDAGTEACFRRVTNVGVPDVNSLVNKDLAVVPGFCI